MKKIIILISALILCAPILTCSDTGQTVNLKIYYSASTTGGGISGFYVADAGDLVAINDPYNATTTLAGTYQQTIPMTTSLKVQVSSKALDNFITVMIYKDSLIVKEGTSTGTGTSGSAATVTLTYEYDPEKDTTTSSSTTQ